MTEEQTSTFEIPTDTMHLSDLGNSRLLVQLHGKDLRWCGAMPDHGWLRWDRNRWVVDNTQEVVRLAMRVPEEWRERAPPEVDQSIGLSEEDTKKAKIRKAMLAHALKSESAAGLTSMVKLASAHADIATKQPQWDADPWLFNTPNLTYNFQTMKQHEPRRTDLITKSAMVGAEGDCPKWKAFLLQIMDNDQEMVDFLQRVVGYCLTGSTKEQCLFIFYGGGNNGKGTFVNTLIKMMADYAASTPAETFTNRREGSIPNDLARLSGVRLVSCAETKEGGGLDEALVKQATGGDPIPARYLNREWFDFLPIFKIIMQTNHKPIIRGTDRGIWRRIRLVPFTVSIPDNELDMELSKKLEQELTGIMRWAIRGVRLWREHGLNPPKKVTEATADYRKQMDILGEFMEECCVVEPERKCKNGVLYERFNRWLKDNGTPVRSHRWMTQALQDKGFKQADGRSGGREWAGIDLAADQKPQPPAYNAGERKEPVW